MLGFYYGGGDGEDGQSISVGWYGRGCGLVVAVVGAVLIIVDYWGLVVFQRIREQRRQLCGMIVEMGTFF